MTKYVALPDQQLNTKSIAFYAPLKSPSHAIPSGDRKIARLFIKALEHADFDVILASNLRSFDKFGDSNRQQRMIKIAKKKAHILIKNWAKKNIKPCAWFSYHLYYKAPDLIGPIVCQQLKIPYIVAEASWAEKRATGPWALYHQHVDKALKLASKVICINPIDKIALDHYYAKRLTSPVNSLNAFIDDSPPLAVSRHDSISQKQLIAQQFGLDASKPWLIAIAMMREGDKFHSYTLLQQVINKLDSHYQLLIVGDGKKFKQVSKLFCHLKQVKFAGLLNNQRILSILPHFEILLWPAVNEAIGMIFLEAQQAGVTVIAGKYGGVSSVIKHQYSGLLIDNSSTDKLIDEMHIATKDLLNNRIKLKKLQENATNYIAQTHSLASAANALKTVIKQSQQDMVR
jgi:glycosyltransferase involved in cell wall biosynthesis